jgi:uncharacterized protein YmfQ (DUF2313 family)
MNQRASVLTAALVVAIGSVPIAATAQDRVERKERVERSGEPGRYSDRDRMKSAKDAEDKLENALKTGEEKQFYRRELEKLGWRITAVNYDKADYLEYEIVKGKDSYEVQIEFDDKSRKAKEVDVAPNIWKTDATERALRDGKQVAYPKATTPNPERYSDRDRGKIAKVDADKLEQALKTGEEKQFYRRELEKMGWKVTAVNHDKPDYVEYEIVKGDNSYEVQIDIDKNSRKASKVDVAPNIWKAEATEKALRAAASSSERQARAR